ncbi:unnamed protein product, partial [Prorocentrum cordatum]
AAGCREAPRGRAFAAAAAQLFVDERGPDKQILVELVRPRRSDSGADRRDRSFDLRRSGKFEGAPLELLEAPWKVCGSVEWKRPCADMPVLEAEALLYGARRQLRSADNLGSRWVASELNPADGPSRGRGAPSDPLAGLRRELADAAAEGRDAGARQAGAPRPERAAWLAARRPSVGDMGLLRRASVSAETQAQCSLYLGALNRFCDTQGPRPCTEEEWDMLTSGLMEIMFMEGGPLSSGKKLLASVQWAEPRLGWLGGGRMPISRQCLRGWRRAALAGGRLPLPCDVVALLACWMICRGQRARALAVLVMMELYLRPGEPFLLRGHDVRQAFEEAAAAWRLKPLGLPDAYRFRHAGASVDFATGARRLGESVDSCAQAS